MSRRTPPADCRERQLLFEEFRSWNRTLNEIHQAEVLALLADDLPTFESLKSQLQEARQYRDKVSEALQNHIREHGC